MPSDSSELCIMTIAQVGPLLRDRRLSPVELVRAHLARIEALDGKLHSFVTLLPERALAHGGRRRWRLHGSENSASRLAVARYGVLGGRVVHRRNVELVATRPVRELL